MLVVEVVNEGVAMVRVVFANLIGRLVMVSSALISLDVVMLAIGVLFLFVLASTAFTASLPSAEIQLVYANEMFPIAC